MMIIGNEEKSHTVARGEVPLAGGLEVPAVRRNFHIFVLSVLEVDLGRKEKQDGCVKVP